jgi:hypothetical protein
VKVTAEDIAQLLASPPPRAVPPRVAKAVLVGRGIWFLPLFGLVFGGMGLLFTFLFFPWRFQDDWRLAADGVRTTPGVITAVTDAHMEINEVKVMKYRFAYTPDAGRRREGQCFTTGRRWTDRDTVTVRYLPAQPDLACVEGARLSKGGWGGSFVVIFPLVGGGLLYWFVADRRSKRRLLRTGLVAEVDVVSVENTNAKVNEQPVYKITISSPAGPGSQPVMVRRFNPPDVNLALKHFQDKQPVFVLYDPARPKRLIFPEALIDGGA